MPPEPAVKWAACDGLDPVMAHLGLLDGWLGITDGNTDTPHLVANDVVSVGTVWADQTAGFIGRSLVPATVRTGLPESGQVGDGKAS